MRLWHKALIPVLPRQQLLAQWRECCCIARNIYVDNTPNHILVNKIMNYPLNYFVRYSQLVYKELIARGYKADWNKFSKWLLGYTSVLGLDEDIFKGWHDDRYLIQCFFNLQEKYDCGGLTEAEWNKITHSEIVRNLFTKNPHTMYNF